MIQMQALNFIINNKDEDLLNMYGRQFYFKVDPNDKDEVDLGETYDFILKYYQKYKDIPSQTTMVSEFDEEHFKPLTTTESKEYVVDKLYSEWTANETARIIDEVSPDFEVDPEQALENLKSRLAGIAPRPNAQFGVDIIQTAPERYESLIRRREHPEDYWFPTGLEHLDRSIDGIRRSEEFLVIFARTNNLKSWLAEKMAVAVWEQGYNVGFFSPEMSAESVGQRFDTLFKHFSNRGIQGSDLEFDPTKYANYSKKLPTYKPNKEKDKTPVFSVTHPATFNKNVTITALKRWITILDLKMIILDGLTYLSNERSNGKQNTTDKLTEISEDLMSLSVEMNIPIIAVVQANREAARDKDGDVANDAPEIDTIRGSDGISHNASRVLSIIHKKSREEGDSITIYVNKNRYGAVGQKLIWKVDIDKGLFVYSPNPKDGFMSADDDQAELTAKENENYDDAESNI